MNLRGLSFESMPPLCVPYRFFVSAPLFIVAIGFSFLLITPEDLSSRWNQFFIAITHAATLGFMLMIMLGALFQILPVISGCALPQAKKLAKSVHFSLLLGTVLLALGLNYHISTLLTLGAMALFLALFSFLIALISRFSQMPKTPTSHAIRLAGLSLLITVGFGFSLVIGRLFPNSFTTFRLWTDIHLLWGLAGWCLLLIMGVSFQIVPMFYVTKDYSKKISQQLPTAIFIQLILISIFHTNMTVEPILFVTLALSILTYACYTLYLLSQRKRKSRDITIWFWQLSMTSMIISSLLFLVDVVFNQFNLSENLSLDVTMAVMIIMGTIIALITGMLLKIVPFLVWLNLQQAWIKLPSRKMPLSNMQQVIPNNIAARIYGLFVASLISLIIVVSNYQIIALIKLTGILLILCFGYLLFHLVKAGKLYKRLSHEMISAS